MTSGIAFGVSIELDVTRSHHVQITEPSKGVFQIKTTGNDPWVMARPLGKYDPQKDYVLAFDYFCAKGLSTIQLYYGPPIRETHSAGGPEVLSSEGWTSYSMNIRDKQRPGSWKGGYKLFRLDFGTQGGRVIQVKNIKLRPPNAQELKAVQDRDAIKKSRAEFEARMQEMVAKSHAIKIRRVEVTDSTVKITGRRPGVIGRFPTLRGPRLPDSCGAGRNMCGNRNCHRTGQSKSTGCGMGMTGSFHPGLLRTKQ